MENQQNTPAPASSHGPLMSRHRPAASSSDNEKGGAPHLVLQFASSSRASSCCRLWPRRQQPPRTQQAGRVSRITPGLLLDVWVMVSVFFIVGLAQGDKWVAAVASRAKGHSAQFMLADLVFVGPFCWRLSPSINVQLAAPVLCQVVGALLAAAISQRRNRRATLWVACGLYAASRVLQLSSMSSTQFLVASLLVGAATGVALQVTFVDMIELAPRDRRGTLMLCLFLGQNLGALCGSLLVYGLSSIGGGWAWRLVPAYCLWIDVLLMVLLVWLPPTPAALVRSGRLMEGRQALQEVRGYLTDVTSEFDALLHTAHLDKSLRGQLHAVLHDDAPRLAMASALGAMLLLPALSVTVKQDIGKFVFMQLFSRSERPADMNGKISGTDLVLSYIKSDTINMVLQQTGMLLGNALALAVADRLGRKRSCCIAFLLSAVLGVAVVVFAEASGMRARTDDRLIWTAAVGVCLSVACIMGGTSLMTIYLLEVQPLSTRVVAVATIISLHGLQMFVWQLMYLNWLCALHGWGVYLASGLLSLLFAVLCLALMLDTRGQDDVAPLWAQHWFWRRFISTEPVMLAAAAVAAGKGDGSVAGGSQHKQQLHDTATQQQGQQGQQQHQTEAQALQQEEQLSAVRLPPPQLQSAYTLARELVLEPAASLAMPWRDVQ